MTTTNLQTINHADRMNSLA